MAYRLKSFFMAAAAVMFFYWPAAPVHANNLRITNVSLEDRDPAADTMVVEFDITWDNSWRDSTNFDAAWVFVKACAGDTNPPNCSATGWEHAKLATAGLNPFDTDSGSNADTDIYVPWDKVGVFIRRKAEGTGSFSSSNVRLTIDYSSFASDTTFDTDYVQLRVFGIEMVYIPEEPFYAGDGSDESSTVYYIFHNSQDATHPRDAYLMGSNVLVGNNSSSYALSWNTGAVYNAPTRNSPIGVFPSGYYPFYLMKYEMSQSMYRDFLNTLTEAQQKTRTGGNAASVDDDNIPSENYWAVSGTEEDTYRSFIKTKSYTAGSPATFMTDGNNDDIGDSGIDGEWVGHNYVKWPDVAAVADWAGLRPMTELEFEKAARGPISSVSGEYAWGSTISTMATPPISNSATINESVTTTGEGLVNLSTGEMIVPLRSGFAATSGTGRLQAGAGYYGNMDLTGNLSEPVVSLGNSIYWGFHSHGDGTLVTGVGTGNDGNATNVDWPGISATTSQGVKETASGRRGGTFSHPVVRLRTSDRAFSYGTTTSRLLSSGIRLARTAWNVETKVPRTAQGDTGAWTCTGSLANVSDDTYCTRSIPAALTSSVDFSSWYSGSDPWNIGDTAEIKGIVIAVERNLTGGFNVWDYDVVFSVDQGGSTVWSDSRESLYGTWTESDQIKQYGSPVDTWGLNLSPALINNIEEFHLTIFNNNLAAATVDIDYVRMTVYYDFK